MSADERATTSYDLLPGLRSSVVKAGRESMKAMHYAITHPKPTTPPMRWGSLAHAVLLETEAFKRRVVALDTNDKRTAAWKEHVAIHGEWAVTIAEWNKLMDMRDAVWGCDEAVEALRDCVCEVPVTWDGGEGVGPLKAKLDGDGTFLCEYKSAADVTPFAFQRSAYRMGYHVQLGMYSRGQTARDGNTKPVKLIVQCSSEPYDVVVYNVPPTVLEAGWDEAEEIIRRYRIAEKRGVFPGVARGCLEFQLPSWAAGSEWTVGKE